MWNDVSGKIVFQFEGARGGSGIWVTKNRDEFSFYCVGGGVDMPDKDGRTLLVRMIGSRKCSAKAVRCLIIEGADINSGKRESVKRPIFSAICNRHFAKIRLLAEYDDLDMDVRCAVSPRGSLRKRDVGIVEYAMYYGCSEKMIKFLRKRMRQRIVLV